MKHFFLILIAMALVSFSSMSQVTYSDALYRNAQAGDAQAMADLGWCYAYGEGVSVDHNRAIELYNKAIALGNPVAIRRLGHLYKYGEGVQQNYSKALDLYKKAADLGDTNAMNNLGAMIANGEGTPPDNSKAMFWFKKAADLGDFDAMCNIAAMYKYGEGVPQDILKAMEWYQKAANKGSKDAYYQLGLICYNGEGVTKNIDSAIEHFAHSAAFIEDYSEPDEAFEVLQYICQYDNKNGQFSKALASQTFLYDAYKKTWDKIKNQQELKGQVAWGLILCYTYAIGTTRNISKAKELLEAVKDSHPYHTFQAAELYERGDLGSVDYAKAFEFYDRGTSADPGNCGVMTAKYLIEGKGVTKDVNEAIKRLNDAIYFYEESGSEATFAKYVLGKLYFEGTDVKQNRAEAFKLFKVAAEDEEDPNDEAMNMLSTCYRFGYGTAKDLKKAEYWLKKAEETGNERARRIKQLLGR